MEDILSLEDIGKKIAIPGAADLETTTVSLVKRQEVLNAKMTNGSEQLVGTLLDGDGNPTPFLKTVHEGRRITVAGAGPGNTTLISDIFQVIDKKTIRLGNKAAKTVSGVTVIMNDPERIALDDYARQSVSGLTLPLSDRTITDGEMIVGGRVLISKTAKFSSEDLHFPLKIQGAGLLDRRQSVVFAT